MQTNNPSAFLGVRPEVSGIRKRFQESSFAFHLEPLGRGQINVFPKTSGLYHIP
jgi:hypothetical protein